MTLKKNSLVTVGQYYQGNVLLKKLVRKQMSTLPFLIELYHWVTK